MLSRTVACDVGAVAVGHARASPHIAPCARVCAVPIRITHEQREEGGELVPLMTWTLRDVVIGPVVRAALGARGATTSARAFAATVLAIAGTGAAAATTTIDP